MIMLKLTYNYQEDQNNVVRKEHIYPDYLNGKKKSH